jgi:hypothetical protein
MKTDVGGGASNNDKANDKLEDRLAGRFAVELDRAERDYPALRPREKQGGARPPVRNVRGKWPRLALPVTTAAVLAVAVLIAGSAWSSSVTGPSFQPVPPASAPTSSASDGSGVVMGSDGIPTQINDQRVYRVTDKVDWENLSGSFLLGGHAFRSKGMVVCVAQTQIESDLAPCGGVLLASSGGAGPMAPALTTSGVQLNNWIGGPAVVARVHTHDPRAVQCRATYRAFCDEAVIVEAVVWPVVPTEIDGQRVYRAADQASFANLTGSFLLGGPVAMPDVIPPCPDPLGKSDAELQLIPNCSWGAIDGHGVAPKSALGAARNEIVVARVHVHDPLASQCPANVRADCEAAIVVEAVVWQSDTGQVSPTPPAAPSTSGNAASSQVAGPSAGSSDTGAVQLGPDGVPTAIGAERVYRASKLPTAQAFLLGGRLTRDITCPAPTSPLANPPACGYWMLDGVKVGTMIDLPESLLDQVLVARVDRARKLAVCPGVQCSLIGTIVITQIVWQTLTQPPPPVPSAS